MTLEERAALRRIKERGGTISASELTDQTDRTLVYGYDIPRETVHVYLKDGLIHLFTQGNHVEAETWDDLNRLVPRKRSYQEHCDYEFCALLIERGADISFTSDGSSDERKPWAGEIYAG
jgi:hypothetical protein